MILWAEHPDSVLLHNAKSCMKRLFCIFRCIWEPVSGIGATREKDWSRLREEEEEEEEEDHQTIMELEEQR